MEHNPNLTAAYLMGAVDKHVKGQARRTVKLNAERDPNARYARIPDGEACEFCKALGSRGFIYHSEESASERKSDGKSFHPWCNCQIAVSFDPFIEDYWVGPVHVTRGYGMEDAQLVRPGRDGSFELRDVDIDELFEQYKAAGKSFNKRSVYRDYAGMPKFMADPLAYLRGAESVEQLEKRADEVLAAYKRYYDEKQLAKYLPSARAAAQGRMAELKAAVEPLRYNAPSISMKVPDYSKFSGKQFSKLTENELEGHQRLAALGHDVIALPTDRSAAASIDMIMDGEYWELKTPTRDGGRLKTRIGEGVSKWERLRNAGVADIGSPRIVVDNRFCTLPDKEAVKVIRQCMAEFREADFSEAILIRKSGRTTRIKK